MSNGIGRVWAVNAEGGDEGRPNGVGPVWIENADQLGSKLPEPEAGDTGKVLGVLNADGDIGWVPDQEGMAQVQADWDQTDSSQVNYIANKPSLATVATTGAYSDLSGTPTVDQVYDATSANAQSGTAVAQAVANAGLYEATYDVSTYAEVKAAFDLHKIVYCKVGNRQAFLAYTNTTSILTSNRVFEFQYYRSNSTADAGDSVFVYRLAYDNTWTTTERAAYVNADWNSNSGASQVLNKPTIPSVDQTYNSASANAQSGTAVAQAIAAIPSSSYTAGNGIAISSSKAISAVGGDGITVTGPSTSSVNLYAPTRTNGTSVSMFTPLTADLVSMIETGGLTVVPSIDLTSMVEPTVGLYAGICTIGNYNLIDTSQRLVLGQVNLSVTHTQVPDPEDPEFLEDYYTAASNGATLVYDIDDLNSTLSKTLTWADVKASPSNYAIVLLFFRVETSCKIGSYDTGSSSDAFNTGVYTTVTPGAITVTNPLPTSVIADASKVLAVNNSGAAAWATLALGSVQSIQQVNSLPASPDANTLYLIPEA